MRFSGRACDYTTEGEFLIFLTKELLKVLNLKINIYKWFMVLEIGIIGYIIFAILKLLSKYW